MLDITSKVKEVFAELPDNIEVFWAKNHEKIVFFKDDDFNDFVNLNSDTNKESQAISAALRHLRRG